MKKIPLRSRKGNLQYALVDDEDFERASRFKWYLSRGSRINYVLRNTYTKDSNGKLKKGVIKFHRFLMNPPTNKVIDHINHNTLDNRKNNLRICSSGENIRNQIISKRNTSGFKGVIWLKDTNKWRARANLNKKQYHFGIFKNKKDAARAYNEGIKNLFKEFAYPNLV